MFLSVILSAYAALPIARSSVDGGLGGCNLGYSPRRSSRVTCMAMEMEVTTIRRAAVDDTVAVAAISDAAYSKYVVRIGRKPRPMTVDYAELMVNHDIWLLTQDETPIGVLVLKREQDHLLIYSVAIQPEYQHRGYGRNLLKWAEALGEQGGYHEMRLYTNAQFEENIRLYERVGYRESHREPLQDGGTIVYMSKAIGA